MFKLEIDTKELTEHMTDAERRQFPFALQQTLNGVAFETRGKWRDLMYSSLDRPTPYTANSVFYDKADYRKRKLYVDVFVRDGQSSAKGDSFRARTEVSTGTPPAKYLQWQERGGARRQKAFERKLGSMSGRGTGVAQYYVAGRGAKLDQYGNVPRGVLQKIVSQLRVSEALAGSKSNETEALRRKREKRQRIRGGGGRYFVLSKDRGKLKRGGIYERIVTGFGSAVRSVLYPAFTPPRYRARLGAIDLANAFMSRRFLQLFPAQMAQALARKRR